MAIVVQMLTAAFNPTGRSSGTRVSTVLFPNGDIDASVVFGISDNCNDIVNNKIRSLQQDFQKCRSGGYSYVPFYPSFCGESTSAVSGLDVIYNLIPNPPKTKSAVVILTDGIIIDDPTERDTALNRLTNRDVQAILAAGVKSSGKLGASVDNLKLYTINNNEADAILRENVIDVGIGIIGRMAERGIICPNHGNI